MKKHRRRRTPKRVVLGKIVGLLSSLGAHGFQSTAFAVLSLVLAWLVLTKSLPYALAPSNPETALALNPNNPAALIAKAEKVHAQLLAATAAQTAPQDSDVPAGDTISNSPEADIPEEPRGELDRLRKEVRGLAIKAITNDPLNAEPYRLLAETTGNTSETRKLMQETLKRSRRNLAALLWLLNDSTYHKDFEAALDDADLLLRTNPDLTDSAVSYMAPIVEDADGRSLLVQELAKSPPWRNFFFFTLPLYVKDPNAPFELMIALQERGVPPTNKELAPYLTFLINSNSVEAAYKAWLQFLPKAEHDTLGLLTHPNFERDPTGLVFDWQIARGINAIAEILPLDDQTGRTLHVSFGGGRAQFPEVTQVLRLAPGKYRLEGKFRGSVTAKRGLRWQIRCLSGPPGILGETGMIMGRAEEWRVFSLEAEVPETEDCQGQTLRLFHDSRMASEELISGEAWFAALHLERISEPTMALQ